VLDELRMKNMETLAKVRFFQSIETSDREIRAFRENTRVI
jgi:hypothetical protein